jgi:hypothetical protein
MLELRPLRSLAALAAVALSLAPAQAQGSTATYEVRFEATWSAQTHPGAYPGGAHFSPLVGGTHDGSVHFWMDGGLATPGIESMAETGATGTLVGEINAAITAGGAGQVILGPGIGSPGVTSSSFSVSDAHSRVTLVTMIAPSPDWFVGVDAAELRPGGQWLNELTVPLLAWDAGTDDGTGFSSPNQNSSPQQPIALITGGPFTGSDPLGTFTFRRVLSGPAVYCTAKVNSQGCTPQIAFSGSPSLSNPTPFTLSAGQVLNNKPGIFFYGTQGPASQPFLGGTLCVRSPIKRTAAQVSGGTPPPAADCSGTFSYDFNALIQSGSNPALQLGTIVGGQFWSRDPAHPDGTGSNTTDAVEFQIGF